MIHKIFCHLKTALVAQWLTSSYRSQAVSRPSGVFSAKLIQQKPEVSVQVSRRQGGTLMRSKGGGAVNIHASRVIRSCIRPVGGAGGRGPGPVHPSAAADVVKGRAASALPNRHTCAPERGS